MTGLIYVGIIAVWAVVLVPAWLRRHDHRDPERSVDRFAKSLQALARRDTLLGIKLPASPESETSEGADVGASAADVAGRSPSTRVVQVDRSAAGPVSATAAPRRRRGPSPAAARRAAARRRVVLGLLTASLAAVAGFVVAGVLLPIALLIPTALIGTFVVTARYQVRAAERARAAGSSAPVGRATVSRPHRRPESTTPGQTWEAQRAPLPTYVTAPRAAEFPRNIDTATPGAWTAAAMLERAQQQKDRAERMAMARAEAVARAKAEQAAAEARTRDEEYLAQESADWSASHTTTPIVPTRRVVNE